MTLHSCQHWIQPWRFHRGKYPSDGINEPSGTFEWRHTHPTWETRWFNNPQSHSPPHRFLAFAAILLYSPENSNNSHGLFTPMWNNHVLLRMTPLRSLGFGEGNTPYMGAFFLTKIVPLHRRRHFLSWSEQTLLEEIISQSSSLIYTFHLFPLCCYETTTSKLWDIVEWAIHLQMVIGHFSYSCRFWP